MPRVTVFIVAALCFALTTVAVAETQKVYFNIGLAGASASYPDAIQGPLDLLEDMPGIDHVQVGIDLGLYFAVNPGSIFGFSLNGIGDRYDDGSDHLQLNQYLYAASYRYYPGKRTGRGLFLRGDVGIARLVLDVSGFGSEASDSGFGFLLGGGYSFAIGGGTWMSINADYTSKSIEDETVSGYTIGLALLI